MEIDQHISKGKRIRKIILFALFICIITLPLLEYGLNVSNEYENTENRNKATLPKFTISNIDSFPNRFDEYFSDNHNFRGDLLMLNSLFKINVLNISPVKDIVEGKNGWYYRTKYIEPYINERLFNNIELDSFNAILLIGLVGLPIRVLKTTLSLFQINHRYIQSFYLIVTVKAD